MQYLPEANLAWSLIDVARPELDARERNHVFVSVGAGDSFTAIRILLKLIAAKQIALQPSLIQLCTTWLDAYVLHEDHACLRLLIDSFAVRGADRQPRMTGRLPAPGRAIPAGASQRAYVLHRASPLPVMT